MCHFGQLLISLSRCREVYDVQILLEGSLLRGYYTAEGMYRLVFQDGREVKLFRRWCDMVRPNHDSVIGNGLRKVTLRIVTLGTSDIDDSYQRFFASEVVHMFKIGSVVFENSN